MATNFTGTLNSNEILAYNWNMLISQQVYADNIKGTYSSLVDKARVDGTLYGDTKLYYDCDVLQTHEFAIDAEGRKVEAKNLLDCDFPVSPEVQAITLDTFRQIRITLENYATKRAWMNEGNFRDFNSVMLKMVRDTKKVYDSTIYNTFIGTNETNIGEQNLTIPTAGEGQNDALIMAEYLANLLVRLQDVSREYNDNEFLKSFDEGDLMVIWSAEKYNSLKKVDLPVIFGREGLMTEFDQVVLPSRYFGKVAGTSSSTLITGGDKEYRSLVEKDVALTDGGSKHLYPGDLIPTGSKFPSNECYEVDDTIAFKLIHKKSVPYMSAFEVATSFTNPRSLTENHYLTFGHNSLQHLMGYPFITVRYNDAD